MKMSVQVANLDKPNSREHTHVIAMVNAKDTFEVLKQLIININPEVQKLKEIKWNSKSIKVFLFGDYAFVCDVFGLSGARGKYPCLWCLTTSDDIQTVSQGPIEDRTLTSIHKDHEKYLEAGNKKMLAKQFHNCIRQPLMDIEIEMVVPMYLHILLGIVLKHHTSLEAKTHIIDEKLANLFSESHSYNDMGLTSFDNHVRLLKRIEELKEKVIDLEVLVADSINTKQKVKFEAELLKSAQELTELNDSLNETPLKQGTGPVTSGIEGVLLKHKIDTKGYHGGSFIGNHCHKYMHDQVYTDITKYIIDKTATLTNDEHILQLAQDIRLTFDTLNESFSKVHFQISHCRKIDQSELNSIQVNIQTYMDNYRKYFPNKVIPKQHILEHHCLSFIETYGFGLGLLGEQGGELLHASMSQFEKRSVGIRNPLKRMRSVIESHRIQNSPSLRNDFPVITKRRKKLDFSSPNS